MPSGMEVCLFLRPRLSSDMALRFRRARDCFGTIILQKDCMLKYSLRENLLTPDPDDCMGRNLRLLTEFAIRQTRVNFLRKFLRIKNSVSTRSVWHVRSYS